MCGITGIFAFNQVGAFYMINLGKSIDLLSKRGPDQRGSYIEDFAAIGHRRLSILDLSAQGRQPMEDISGRYTIVFNGEIFNFKNLKNTLAAKGYTFTSQTDTEVLLNLYLDKKEACLNDLIGFFSFAVYDKEEKSLFLARDRFGIKPLFYYLDEDKFIFASEMKSVVSFNIPKEIDFTSLYQYLHFNYIPGPATILQNVFKLEPGHYLKVRKNEFIKERYYNLDEHLYSPVRSYQEACDKLKDLLEESVQLRMISDVPLGTFLSGGIDSSVITALAARHTDKLNTFTIGFSDEKFFDETGYAAQVAKKYNTEHSVFNLSNKELYEGFEEALSYIDEPFADSSALAVYMLSKKTAEKVKVALSGDGADEIFAGYNKHRAEYMIRHKNLHWIQLFSPLLKFLPKSRSGPFSDRIRKLDKLAAGLKSDFRERYYNWAGFSSETEISLLLTDETVGKMNQQEFAKRKAQILKHLNNEQDFNQILRSDLELVLPNDMLVKVDMMSMANSLEVRVPFLDHRIVEFGNSLPSDYKINGDAGKKIIRDTFGNLLPPDLLSRSKKGFEIPLLKWLRTGGRDIIEKDLLSDKLIQEQGIFRVEEVKRLKMKLYSSDPGDAHAKIWAMMVFQFWYKKFIIKE